ncbi:MAG: DUF1566 domain-containing protein [Candidatus Electrothrix gigas]
MGKVIYLLFFFLLAVFFLLAGIFFYLKDKTATPDPVITINDIRKMQERGAWVQFPSEREPHLLSATIRPRDLLKVELLKLSGSSLYSVPPWFKRLTNLRCLNLSKNNLDADNDLLETLRAMPKLDVLNLSNNSLFKFKLSQDISFTPVWQVLNLGELYLRDTQGTAKNYGSLATLRALQTLDLSNNRIGDDVAILKLNKLYVLDTLNLSHNRLTQFPGQYLPMSQLRELDVSHNNLTKISYFEMRQLEVFYLQGNGAVSMVDDYSDPFCLPKLRLLLYDSGSKIPQELIDRFDKVQEDNGIITAELASVEKPPVEKPRYIIDRNGTVTDRSTRLMWKRCPEGLSGVNCGNGVEKSPVEKPRYIIDRNGTVTDRSTRLMWKRCPEGLSGVHCGNGVEKPPVEKPRYIIDRNGTVTDRSTRLMWKRCPEGLSGVNCENGNANTYTWDYAIQHFRGGSSYAGYSDWRMPTIDELRELVYCSNGTGVNNTCGCKYRSRDPTINIQVFPNTPSSVHWSASPYTTPYTRGAWGVYFNDGCAAGYARDVKYTVRLVRDN